jgi:NhaP-type Na+/H+ or K+/H+ antiporter
MSLEFELTTAASVFAVFGLIALGMTMLPRLLHERPLSFPVLYVAAGWALFSLPLHLPEIDPLRSTEATVRLTEVGVIVALFGVGLKIRRPMSLRAWSQTWRLLAVAMPITIGLAAGLAAWWLGFDPAAAVLFGAVLAPTDPVLASDVQQQSPGDDDEEGGDVRFALTSEAGLNDALAFPFTMAAIAMVELGSAPSNWAVDWLAIDVGYRLAVGLAGGFACGWALRVIAFRAPVGNRRLAETGEGLVALAGTFLTYGLTELAEGYGFLAVFVAAQYLRAAEREHEYHAVVHDFSEQIERLVNGVVLVLFGAAIADGLLSSVTPEMVAVAGAILLVVRPLSALVALGGPSGGKWITAFYGIRGVGSLFYLSYALEDHDFGVPEELWAVVSLTILGSIVLHGLTAGPAMHRYDRRRRTEPETT